MSDNASIIKDFLKRIQPGTKLVLHVKCCGSSSLMDDGHEYSQNLEVIKVRAVRRQHEEPGKEILFRASSLCWDPKTKTHRTISGYSDLKTSGLCRKWMPPELTLSSDRLTIVFPDDHNVTQEYIFT